VQSSSQIITKKDFIRRQTLESEETVIQTINDWFEQLDEKFIIDGAKAFGRHWGKSIALEGDYVDKL